MGRLIFVSALAAFFTFASAPAMAGLLVEPYVGYYSGKWTKGNCNCSAGQSGATFGARAGVESEGFMLGADAMSGSWIDKNTPSDDETPASVGAFVGYTGRSFRIYGGYGIASSLKQSAVGYSDTFTGTDYKVGFGFLLVPLIAINIEYLNATYTKDSSGPLTQDVKSSMWGASLSIPVDF